LFYRRNFAMQETIIDQAKKNFGRIGCLSSTTARRAAVIHTAFIFYPRFLRLQEGCHGRCIRGMGIFRSPDLRRLPAGAVEGEITRN
jgi:hypothetical protein